MASLNPKNQKVYGDNKVWLNKIPAVNGDPRCSNVPMMRLSEVYLTAAECAFNLGNKTKAAEYLNAIIENRTSDETKLVTAENITANESLLSVVRNWLVKAIVTSIVSVAMRRLFVILAKLIKVGTRF